MKSGKEYIEGEIKKHLSFILFNIDFKEEKIAIHLNSKLKTTDIPRTFFILFTLSRLYKYKFIDSDLKSKLLKLFWSIYNAQKTKLKQEDFRYLQLYGMRALNNFGESYDLLIEDFKNGDYASLYTHPVTAYVFLSTFFECKTLETNYPFSRDILHEVFKSFDFWIFSSSNFSLYSFAFSELSLWQDHLPKYWGKGVTSLLEEKVTKELAGTDIYSSGLAKTLEHYTRVGDMQKQKQILDFLDKRSYNFLQDFYNPILKNFGCVFLEEKDSQYICLDTNAHLIHSYLNLYEKYI